ncbi:MAG: MMPL family transporter [Bacteroidales bacterium]|nr:MMPL family transporter [Bacteroidales bacterium]
MTYIIYRYRWVIILICIIGGLVSFAIIPMIKIDPEIRNYIPATIESRIITDKIEDEFGVQDMVMIMFRDSCILTNDNLQHIKEIDMGISKISGVSSRMSPFTVKSIRDEDGMMIAEPLLTDIPDNPYGSGELADKILKNKFARGVVVSSDLTTASITANINKSAPENVILGKIDSVINCKTGRAEVVKGGLPYIRKILIGDVGKDAVILIPAALLIMLLVLKLNLGSWRSVIMPFSAVVLSVGFSMALASLAGWKMSIITVLVPVILIAVANNYGIYLVARFQELKIRYPEKSDNELVRILIRSLQMPILFSGLTTIAGILGLLAHSIIPARQVGILAASGVAVALLLSLSLIPASIFISGIRRSKYTSGINRTRFFDKLLARLTSIVIQSPGKILVSSLVIILLFSIGFSFLRIDTNQEIFFSKKHPVKKASELINSKFGGSQTISVMISGDIKNPEIMKGIDKMTNDLEKQKGVGGVFSISQVVREMSKAIYTDTEYGYDQIPETGEGIAQMFELYNMSGNPDDFEQLMNLDNTRAHLLIRLSDPDNRTIKDVKKRIDELSSVIPAEVSVGGYAIIMADFAGSIIRGQVYSLVFAVITVFLLLAGIFRSLKGGLIGSIPLVASIMILFGFMGFTGIALDAATALLSSIMIGVGVDFTIQYIWCFNLQINAGLSYPKATETAIRTIGRSIIINALSVMSGFSALIFSGFTSIRFFGYLVIISIASCLAGALIVIPAFLLRFRPGFIGFTTNSIKNNKHETEYTAIGSSTAAFASSSTAT